MKGFAKIALSVALIAVIVLSIVVASVAWFTSNPEVGANDVTMNSARTLTVTFDSNEEGSDFKYRGQIGNTARNTLDAPYVYEAGGFNVNINTLSSDDKHGRIKVEFGTVTVVTPSVGTISNVLITDLFHITANCYTKSSSSSAKYVEVSYRAGDPEKTINKNVFVDYTKLPRYEDEELTIEAPNYGEYTEINGRAYLYEDLEERQKYSRSELEIAPDGTLLDPDEVDRVTQQPQPMLFDEGMYSLSFTFTFLSEEGYQHWYEGGAVEYPLIAGYERAQNGTHIGIISYTPYVARDHFGLQRYTRSGTEGNYTYTADPEGGYVRVETAKVRDCTGMQRYTRSGTEEEYVYTEDANGDYVRVGDTYEEYVPLTKYDSNHEEAANGEYIKVGNDYLLYYRYNRINGFPYSADQYRGTKYTFKVNCSVEEV